MTDRDEQLLAQFFEPARQMKIEDGDFSRRVMESLPPVEARPAVATGNKYARWSRLWTAACALLGVVLFVVFDGWGQLALSWQQACQMLSVPVNAISVAFSLCLAMSWLLVETLRHESSIAI